MYPQSDTTNLRKEAIKESPKRTPPKEAIVEPFCNIWGAISEPFWGGFWLLLGSVFLVVRGFILETFWYYFWYPIGLG